MVEVVQTWQQVLSYLFQVWPCSWQQLPHQSMVVLDVHNALVIMCLVGVVR